MPRIFRNAPGALLGAVLGGLTCVSSGCALSIPDQVEVHESIDQLSATDARGREIAYLRSGPKDAPVRVILIHGTPGRGAHLAHLMLGTSGDAEFVSIDRPGFGDTGGLDVTFEGQAIAVEALLRDDARNVLVGHSLGGPIVAWCAADSPERVDAIVVLAGSLSPELEKPRWYNHVGSWWTTRILLSDALNTSNREIMAAPEQTRLLEPKLALVRCPVFILHGTDDGLVPFENVAFMEKMFGDTRITVVDRGGHMLPWANEALTRSVVQDAVNHVNRAR